jgi:hypothetical protein
LFIIRLQNFGRNSYWWQLGVGTPCIFHHLPSSTVWVWGSPNLRSLCRVISWFRCRMINRTAICRLPSELYNCPNHRCSFKRFKYPITFQDKLLRGKLSKLRTLMWCDVMWCDVVYRQLRCRLFDQRQGRQQVMVL